MDTTPFATVGSSATLRASGNWSGLPQPYTNATCASPHVVFERPKSSAPCYNGSVNDLVQTWSLFCARPSFCCCL
eukprot:4253845-Amphidinium_carterae.1